VATDEWQRTGDPEHGGGLPNHLVNAVAVATNGAEEGLALYHTISTRLTIIHQYSKKEGL
jgi:hypothetical protein